MLWANIMLDTKRGLPRVFGHFLRASPEVTRAKVEAEAEGYRRKGPDNLSRKQLLTSQ
jgi:hypothetical protein